MKIRHSAVGLLAAAALALVAGCGTTDGTGGTDPKPSPTLTPLEEIKASTNDIATTSHKFDVKDTGKSLTGTSEPANNAVDLAAALDEEGIKFTIRFLFSGTDRYVKITGLPLPGIQGDKWMKFDMAKIKDASKLGINDVKDPVALRQFTNAIVTAEKTGDKAYKGTVDASSATDNGIFDEEMITGLGDKAKSVPYEATLDDKGRLATIKVTVPAFGSTAENVINVTISQYGTATVTKPAASETVDAPATVYEILNAA